MSKSISISCIDTLNYDKTIRAVLSTINCIPIDKVYWLSDVDISDQLPIPVVWHQIDKLDINNFEDLINEYHLKTIPQLVDTDFNIIVHHDGFAVNKIAWTDEFLNYDYIGAVWPWAPEHQCVGNGGFSLRSKKLYQAFIDLNVGFKLEHFTKDIQNIYQSMGYCKRLIIPEDVIIAKIYRPILEFRHNIKFAPSYLANRWSIEHNYQNEWVGKSFGFHGKHGIHKLYGVEF